MSTPRHDLPDPMLAGVLAQAQAQADRHFGDAPAIPWRPDADRFPMSARLGAGLAGAAVVALAAVGVWVSSRQDIVATPPRQMEYPPARLVEAAPVAPAPHPTPAPAAAPAAPVLDIARKEGLWRIEAVGVSRSALAQRLAQASGSELFGELTPDAATKLMNVRWRGRDLASAWQAVLGADVSFASRCDDVRCRVWIVDMGTLQQASTPQPPDLETQPRLTQPPTPVQAQRSHLSLPAAAAVLEVPVLPAHEAQADSSDARVAAHHD